MSDTIISVENLGKRYSIRHERERYTALRDVIAEKAKGLFEKTLKSGKTEKLKSGNDSSDFSVSESQRFRLLMNALRVFAIWFGLRWEHFVGKLTL